MCLFKNWTNLCLQEKGDVKELSELRKLDQQPKYLASDDKRRPHACDIFWREVECLSWWHITLCSE